ncbi:hypothetical protein BDV09DRAFT_180256 [Aspergillus tetrazonus]
MMETSARSQVTEHNRTMPLMNGPEKGPKGPSQGPEAPNMRDQGFEEQRRDEKDSWT